MLALARRDSALSKSDALRLDELVHRRNSSVPHPRSHRIAVDVLLDSAEKLLKPNSDGWGKVKPAQVVLTSIRDPVSSGQADRRATLTAKADRQSKRVEQWAKGAAEEFMVQQRREMANRMETGMLDKGMDVTVRAEGKNATTLRIKYVLMSRPLVHQFQKNGEFFSNLQKAGFKRVIMTDGYDDTWTWNL
jgi:hypothetical protein